MNQLETIIAGLPAPFNSKLQNISGMMSQVQNNLNGQDPEQYVRNMMSNGQVSQEDFNKAAKIANMLRQGFR